MYVNSLRWRGKPGTMNSRLEATRKRLDALSRSDEAGRAAFTQSCDVAKSSLARAGVPYENEAAPSGAITKVRIGEGSISLRDSIRKLADAGKNKVLLNLAGVKYMDSSGVGELIANYTTLSRQGGQLKLLNLTDRIQNLLVITKLLTVFDTYDNEAEALKSFG